MNIKKTLNNLNIVRAPCEYWDIRIEETNKTEITYEDFELIGCSLKPSLGAFIRIYKHGMWFYSSTTDLDKLSEQIIELCEQASKFEVEEPTIKIKPYSTNSIQKDLIRSQNTRLDKLSISEKKKVCESYFNNVKSFDKLKGVKITYVDEYKVKYFYSSYIKYSYDFNQCGILISYTATDGNNRFDDSIVLYGNKIDDLKLQNENVKRQIEESYLFINARTIEANKYPVVMDSKVVGVFAHESFGHKSEADFMIGDKEAKETWKIGKKVGNKCLSIVDYGLEFGTSGYCPFDDEGVSGQKNLSY